MSVEIKWHGEELKAMLRGSSEAAAFEGANVILDESHKQVPHDTGALEGSGKVVSGGDRKSAYVTYGDVNSRPYAVRWHENDANFQRGRKKKYLEDPANDKAVHDEIMRRIADKMKF